INKPVANTTDTAGVKPIVSPKTSFTFQFDPSSKHHAILILDKVDPMFINEVRNAFSRYHKERFYGQPLEAGLVDFDEEKRILVISGFTNAQEAIDYIVKTKKLVHLEIIPWLKQDKYSF